MAIYSNDSETDSLPQKQRMLQTRHIEMIEEALRSVGEYGEVRLVVEKGKLRFLITQKSVDALKWQPGSLDAKP